MALISCKDCSKEFSDQAAACPNCACPNPFHVASILSDARQKDQQGTRTQAEQAKKGPGCLAICFSIFIILTAIGFVSNAFEAAKSGTTSSSAAGNATATESSQSKPENKTPVFNVMANAIKREFDRNQIAGDKKYKGKVIKITGSIKEIQNSIMDTPTIDLVSSDNEFEDAATCDFPQESKEEISKLKKGTKVSIVGVCDGQRMGSVILNECRFVR